MRCLAVCQDELVIRMLDEILLPGFEVEFIIENRTLARRLHEAGVTVTAGDPRRTDTYLKADIGPSTCVIIEDNGKRSLKKILEAVRDAGGSLVYVLGIGPTATARGAEEFHADFPDVAYLSMAELFGGPLLTGVNNSFFIIDDRLFLTADFNRPWEIDPESMALATVVGSVEEWGGAARLAMLSPPVPTSAHPFYDRDEGLLYDYSSRPLPDGGVSRLRLWGIPR